VAVADMKGNIPIAFDVKMAGFFIEETPFRHPPYQLPSLEVEKASRPGEA